MAVSRRQLVNQSKNLIDLWTIPALALWLVYFAIGLFPEGAFWAARLAGRVVTQNAIINSPSLVTVSLSLYLALFVYQRCTEAGVSRENATARAIQVGILGLIAFLPYPFYLLLSPGNMALPGSGVYRLDELAAIFGLPVAKLLAWLYLFAVIARSYITAGSDVFVNMYPPLDRDNQNINTGSTPE
ncbi:MAG TPA: hypothetical protein PKJ78_17595 [Candidatus Hydrogenedentes bacterium]|nr:hypothetical protein [Candidatus Hydrogenedentota bacterium]